MNSIRIVKTDNENCVSEVIEIDALRHPWSELVRHKWFRELARDAKKIVVDFT